MAARATWLVVLLASGAGGLAVYTRSALPPPGPVWTETAWPLPRDQYPAGKAYDCTGSGCGGVARVTFRAKIGFCNCQTGVADDEELERVGDADLVDPRAKARAAGQEMHAGHMKGRSQLYAAGEGAAAKEFYSIAFNDRCDVIVATATGAGAPHAEKAAIEFLNSERVLKWAERVLGL